MWVIPIRLFSQVRGTVQRAAAISRFYAVPVLAQKKPKVSYSEQVEKTLKRGNFDCNVLELNETGVLRVLSTMRDDPYLALSFLRRIQEHGALPSVQAYASVIRIVSSWGLNLKLDSLFVELIRKGDGLGFSVLDLLKVIGEAEVEIKSSLLLIRISSSLIKAYANLEMFDEVIDVFFLSCCLGYAPDIKALNFSMNRMIVSGKYDMVIAIFWQLEQMRFDVDTDTYVIMAKALYKKNDLLGLEKLLERLLRPKKNPRLFYMLFIEGVCLNQMTTIAYILLKNSKILVGNDLATAYRKVVRGFCYEMKLEDAESVVLDMEETGNSDVYVYSAIIEGHRKNMNISKALDIFYNMSKKGIRINCVIASSILRCYCQMNSCLEAYNLFKEFRDKNIYLDKVCYNVAFGALGKLGRVKEAIKLLREMTGKGIVPDVVNYTTLIDSCCLAGKLEDALAIMDEMKETGNIPDIVTFNVLAGGFARNGDGEKASMTLQVMEAFALKPTAVTHNMIIEGLFVAKKFDEAEDFFNRLEHKCPDNYASMVRGYCEAGFLDQAFEWFIRLEFPLPKNVYFTLFTSLCREDCPEKAQALVRKMEEFGLVPAKSMYGKLISSFCRVKNVIKSQEVFIDLVAKGITPDLFTYTIMINTYCRLNEWREGYGLFEDMKRRGIKPDVVIYTILLDTLPKNNRSIQQRLASAFKKDMIDFDVKPDLVYYSVLTDQQCEIR